MNHPFLLHQHSGTKMELLKNLKTKTLMGRKLEEEGEGSGVTGRSCIRAYSAAREENRATDNSMPRCKSFAVISTIK
jgi:hypothetical protein